MTRILIHLLSIISLVESFQQKQQQQQQQQQQQHSGEESWSLSIRQNLAQTVRTIPLPWDQPKSTDRQCLCPPEDDNDDNLQELAEASFASVGALWAEGLLPTSLVFPDSAEANEVWRTSSLSESELESNTKIIL